MHLPLRLLSLALLLTGSLLCLTDCKKSSEPAPSQREAWLTTPKWQLVSYAEEETTAAGVVTTTTIPLTNFNPCSLDDFEYYRADKSFAVDEGLVKCSTTSPSFIISGTWAFASNETELVINPDQPGTVPRGIRSLTATALSTTTVLYVSPTGTTTVALRTYAAH